MPCRAVLFRVVLFRAVSVATQHNTIGRTIVRGVRIIQWNIVGCCICCFVVVVVVILIDFSVAIAIAVVVIVIGVVVVVVLAAVVVLGKAAAAAAAAAVFKIFIKVPQVYEPSCLN